MAAPASIDYSVISGNVYLQHSRYLPPNGDKQAMFSFRVSVPSRVRDQDTNQWKNGPSSTHFVTAFGRLAENCHNSFHDGDFVIVMGRNKTRSYEQNGETRYSTDLIAENAGLSCYWSECSQKNDRNRGNGGSGNSGHSDGSSRSNGSGRPAPSDDAFSDTSSSSDDSFDPFASDDSDGGGDSMSDLFS